MLFKPESNCQETSRTIHKKKIRILRSIGIFEICGLILIILGCLFFIKKSAERNFEENATAEYKAAGVNSSHTDDLKIAEYLYDKNMALNLAKPRRFAALFTCSLGAAFLLFGVTRRTQAHLLISTWPTLVMAIGLVTALAFCIFYPTAIFVPPENRYTASIDELNKWVENIGLMNNRLAGVVFGIGMALLGGVLMVVDIKRERPSQ